MVIYNNMAAMSVLNEANRQNNKLSASMERVASGLKVRNAGDDASAYSISEKMRVQIRALSQCSANVNKGADITGVAEGAMREQMELLTTVRELAIKSANGVYSDSDRAVMQREVNQRLAEADDIAASAYYNNKPLLNQTERGRTDEAVISGSASFDTEAAETPNNILLVSENHDKHAVKDNLLCYGPPEYYRDLQDGQTVYDPTKIVYPPVTSMPSIGTTVYAAGGTQYTVVDGNTTGYGAAVPAIEYPPGNTPPAYIPLDLTPGTSSTPSLGASGFLPRQRKYDVLGTVGTGGTVTVGASIALFDNYNSSKYEYATLPDGKPAAVSHTKTGDARKQVYSITFDSLPNLPDSLDRQGFSVLCDACRQFVSVIFDTARPAGSGEYCDGTDGMSGCYIIGLQGVTSASGVSGVVKALADGLNNAVGNAAGTNPVELTPRHNVRLNIYTDANGVTQCYLEKTGQALYMYNGIKGKLTIIPDKHIYTDYIKPGGRLYIQGETAASGSTMLKLPNTTLSVLFPGADDRWEGIEPEEEDYPNPWPNEYDGLTDDEKKQKFRREVWPYPEVTDVKLDTCISTQQKARNFLTNIDQALRYLENSITTMGAQHQRMSVMDGNIIVSHENTSAAESTIRDGDMAKEMTAFARYNLLSQSARSMLAQANHNSANVLSLLQ